MKTLEARIAACRDKFLAGIEQRTLCTMVTMEAAAKLVEAVTTPAFPDPATIGNAFPGFPLVESVVETNPWTVFHDEPAPGITRRSWRLTNDVFEGCVNELLAGVPLPMEDSLEDVELPGVGCLRMGQVKNESFLDMVRNNRIPDRRAFLFEEYPESVVFIYRQDRIGYSDKQKQFLIWNGHNYAKIKIYKHNGNVKFWIKYNTGAAGKRGTTWCMWASMRNWGMLGRACSPFGPGMQRARELLSLRPDQEWLRAVARPAQESQIVTGNKAPPVVTRVDDFLHPTQWHTPAFPAVYMVPDPGHGNSKYDVPNAERCEITNLRAFYSRVLGVPVGPQLASLPLLIAKKVVEQLEPPDRDLVVPVLAGNREALVNATECMWARSVITLYYVVRFLNDVVDYHMLVDYVRLCARLGTKPRLRAQKYSSVVEHHDELARQEREQREALDAAERQKRREAFRSDPVFEVLESDDTYLVEHIRDLDRLEAEGKQMHHCVAGYDQQISEGKCGIASIRERNGDGRWTLQLGMALTGIDLTRGALASNIKPKSGPRLYIAQIKGYCNEEAPGAVLDWIRPQLDRLEWCAADKRFARKSEKSRSRIDPVLDTVAQVG